MRASKVALLFVMAAGLATASTNGAKAADFASKQLVRADRDAAALPLQTAGFKNVHHKSRGKHFRGHHGRKWHFKRHRGLKKHFFRGGHDHRKGIFRHRGHGRFLARRPGRFAPAFRHRHRFHRHRHGTIVPFLYFGLKFH